MRWKALEKIYLVAPFSICRVLMSLPSVTAYWSQMATPPPFTCRRWLMKRPGWPLTGLPQNLHLHL